MHNIAMPYRDKAKQRAYQAAWLRERRATWLKGKSCVTCGSVTNLEIDHVDPKAKQSHRVFSWRAERRDAELARTQVLCASCHRRKGQKSGELMRAARLQPIDVI